MTAPSRLASRLGRLLPPVRFAPTLLLGLAILGAWLAAALQHPIPVPMARVLVLLAGGVAGLLTLRWARALIKGQFEGIDRASGRWLFAILVLGLVTALVGLGHEIGGRYFGDEGTFLANAQRMNEGRLLRPWFIYPHLLYTLDAIGLWVASLFPGIVAWKAEHLFGVRGELEVAALVTREVSAAFVVATPPVVFHLARRIAGVRSGLVAAALAALCPLWLEVGHQSISDVPAGFFATLCLACCAELLVHPRAGVWKIWLAAGLTAGLAAGSKYPAGLVALAIFAVWVREVAKSRRATSGLPIATGAALAAFIVATPSLVAFWDQLIAPDGPDLLFGARLYAEAGWTGVVRGSNLLYYGERLRDSFGIGLLLLGVAGLIVLPRDARRRLLWLAPFPMAYAALILAMRIALPRNLMPILPAIATALGCGIVALIELARRRWPAGWPRHSATAALLLATFLPIGWTASSDLIRYARPTTREVAATWLQANLPPGSLIVKEHYTPVVEYPLFFRQPRFVVKLWPDELRSPRHDFVLVASEAYDRYLNPHNLHQKEFVHFAQRYRELFAQLQLVKEWTPNRWRAGPTLKLFAVDPVTLDTPDDVEILAEDARLADEAMRGPAGISWEHEGQWAVFKQYLAGGDYEFSVLGPEAPRLGQVRIVTRLGIPTAQLELADQPALRIELPGDDKYFAYLTLPVGSTATGVRWQRLPTRRPSDP
ncbi:MAG: glycosyltransferase family 39 protein [Thermoanaerobaculia bacterium]|nr:glycosyltransferase family 39 protein [Thermoanaerobaculia bacterium]